MLIVNFKKNPNKNYMSYIVRVIVLQRSMWSRTGGRVVTGISNNISNNPPVRNMACINGNKLVNPSENAKNLNPYLNNKNAYHKTVTQIECEKPDCKEKICDNPCTPNTTEKTIGHVSSNPFLPKKELPIKKPIKISNTNYKGEQKKQFIIRYSKDKEYEPKDKEQKLHKGLTDFLKKNLKSPKDLDDDTSN